MIAEMGMWVAYSKHNVGCCLYIGCRLVNGELRFRLIQLLCIALFRNNLFAQAILFRNNTIGGNWINLKCSSLSVFTSLQPIKAQSPT